MERVDVDLRDWLKRRSLVERKVLAAEIGCSPLTLDQIASKGYPAPKVAKKIFLSRFNASLPGREQYTQRELTEFHWRGELDRMREEMEQRWEATA